MFSGVNSIVQPNSFSDYLGSLGGIAIASNGSQIETYNDLFKPDEVLTTPKITDLKVHINADGLNVYVKVTQ